MSSTDDVQIIYKAIDQMTVIQNKILSTQEKMIAKFKATGTTASTAGDKMASGMKKGEKSLSSIEGQIAKLNHAFGFMGVQLETIDIYMLSAFKVLALSKLLQLAKDSVFVFEDARKSMLGIQVASKQMGISFKDTTVTFNTLLKMGKLSTLDLAEAMRNLLKSGKSLSQVATIIETLIMSGTVFGTQGNMALGSAVKRSTEGILLGISNLMDATRLTKNLDQIYLDFSKTIKKNVDAFTEYDKSLAQTIYFETERTALVKKYAEANVGLTKAISELSLEFIEFKKEIGAGLNIPVTWSIQLTTAFMEGIRKNIDLVTAMMRVQNLALRIPVEFSLAPLKATIAFIKGVYSAGGLFTQKFDIKPSIKGMQEAFDELKDNYAALDDIVRNTYADIFGKESAIYKMLGLAQLPAITSPIDKPPPYVAPAGAKKGDIDWPEDMAKRVDKAFKIFNDNFNANEKEADEWAKQLKEAARVANEELELSVRSQLNLLEVQRTNLEISRKEYYEKKSVLLADLLRQEEAYLTTLSKLLDTTSWRAQVKEVEALKTSLAEVNRALLEISGTFSEGMTFGFKKFIDEAQTSYQAGTEMAEGILNSMSTSLNNVFTDFRKGDLKSWKDYLTSFADMITQALQEVFVKMLVVKMLGASMGMFSGVKMGAEGGSSFVGPPRPAVFHEGGIVDRSHFGAGIGSTVKADEIFAILQTKERVLSRKQNESFESLGKQGNREKGGTVERFNTVFHEKGGIIERFHAGAGLGSSVQTDEILGILQTKERVLSRRQNESFESLGKSENSFSERNSPSVINHFTFPSIDQNSVASFIYQNKDIIANALMTTMRANHPFRR